MTRIFILIDILFTLINIAGAMLDYAISISIHNTNHIIYLAQIHDKSTEKLTKSSFYSLSW